MKKFIRKIIKIILIITAFFVVAYFLLSYRVTPDNFTYGMSFSKFRTDELHLPFEETFIAILDELGARHFRFSAHWPNTEPEDDQFNFKELDFQMSEAQKRGADVVFAVGRRLPRWPECHNPNWAQGLDEKDRNAEVLEYIERVVNRYKEYDNVVYWQIENEPFLSLFAYEHCGDLDEDFLQEEINLVKKLDPNTPILVTDSGNLGIWYKPWRLGDAFGTSLYRYFWNPEIGTFKSRLPASFYKIKHNLTKVFFGRKDSMIIELSAEPWLVQPVVSTPIETQIERMDVEKMEEIVSFAKKTGFAKQYMWGAEWWYWMKRAGHDEYWEYGKTIFDTAD